MLQPVSIQPQLASRVYSLNFMSLVGPYHQPPILAGWILITDASHFTRFTLQWWAIKGSRCDGDIEMLKRPSTYGDHLCGRSDLIFVDCYNIGTVIGTGNAPLHKARAITIFIDGQYVGWLTNIPNMNLIEHLWDQMTVHFHDIHNPRTMSQQMRGAVVAVWGVLSRNPCSIMLRRSDAFLAAHGWHALLLIDENCLCKQPLLHDACWILGVWHCFCIGHENRHIYVLSCIVLNIDDESRILSPITSHCIVTNALPHGL